MNRDQSESINPTGSEPNRTQLTKFRIAIYGVLVERGMVLLTDTTVPSGIITNFPGGGLELGEAPIEALKREFKEEVGIEIEVGELLFCSQKYQQNPEYPHEQLMHIYYRVHHLNGSIVSLGNNEDITGVTWVAPADFNSKRILAVDREFKECTAFLSLF